MGPCAGAESEPRPGMSCLEAVTGRVVDEAGGFVPDLDVTVCGPICFQGTTDEAGDFLVEVGQYVFLDEYSVQPHGRPGRSTYYHRFPEDVRLPAPDMGVLRVLGLPSDGTTLVVKTDGAGAPAQQVQSGEVSLTIPEGTQVVLDIADALLGDEGKKFRARRVPSELTSEFAPGLSDALVHALGPFEAELEPPDDSSSVGVELVVDNVAGWAPGTEIAVSALGTYLDVDWLPPSEFGEIGTATVSEDGAHVVLSADAGGPGLRWLTWIALTPAE